jgi:hypothetical protein
VLAAAHALGVKRPVLIAVVLALALSGMAAAVATAAQVKVDPAEPGEGSSVTLVARGSTSPTSDALLGVSVRLVRGFRANPAAVAERCSAAQAAQTHSCPRDSRIGGGEVELTLATGAQMTSDLDLYLAPRQQPRELAGIVVLADTKGRKGHALGRIIRLDPDTWRRYGLQVTLDHLRGALRTGKAHARITRVSVHIGHNRRAGGRLRHLIRSPGSCGTDGWPWQFQAIGTSGIGSAYGSIRCSPVPTP